METLRLPAKTEFLDRLRAFVLEWLSQFAVPVQKRFEIDLVLEEVLTNIIKYAYPTGAGDVEVCCTMEGPGRFRLTVQDWGVPFNPLTCAEPGLYADVEDRKVGGLGIYLVRQMADRVCYQQFENRNVLEVTFELNE